MKVKAQTFAVDLGRVRILDRLDRTLAELSAAQRPLTDQVQQETRGR